MNYILMLSLMIRQMLVCFFRIERPLGINVGFLLWFCEFNVLMDSWGFGIPRNCKLQVRNLGNSFLVFCFGGGTLFLGFVYCMILLWLVLVFLIYEVGFDSFSCVAHIYLYFRKKGDNHVYDFRVIFLV